MEFEWRDLKNLWELPKTRRSRRLILAVAVPVLLAMRQTYLVGAILTLSGLHTVLKREVLVKWAGGTEEGVEGCFATGIGIFTFGFGIAVLIHAL